MNLIERAGARRFHKNRLGKSPLHELGWRCSESQTRRFEALCQWGDLTGLTVLDLGCGHGDLAPVLHERWDDINYLGVDFLPEFIATAKQRHARDRTRFVCADFHVSALPKVDLVLCSGALNYRSTNHLHPWNTIKRMWNAAHRGVAFNQLHADSFALDTLLHGQDPQEALKYSQQLDPQAQLLTGYLEDDFTILLRKDR